MRYRIIRIFIFLIGIGLIVSLSRDIVQLTKSTGRIKEAEDKVVRLEEEKQALEKKKRFYASDEFIEEEARNRLNMAKPGETILVLPEDFSDKALKTSSESPSLPNWEKWWQLFF